MYIVAGKAVSTHVAKLSEPEARHFRHGEG